MIHNGSDNQGEKGAISLFTLIQHIKGIYPLSLSGNLYLAGVPTIHWHCHLKVCASATIALVSFRVHPHVGPLLASLC